MKPKQPRSIESFLNFGGQTVTFLEKLTFAGRHLRLTIKSDAYRAQCEASVEIFDGTQWHVLNFIPYGTMKTEAGLISKQRTLVTATNFASDRSELIQEAARLLSPAE